MAFSEDRASGCKIPTTLQLCGEKREKERDIYSRPCEETAIVGNHGVGMFGWFHRWRFNRLKAKMNGLTGKAIRLAAKMPAEPDPHGVDKLAACRT